MKDTSRQPASPPHTEAKSAPLGEIQQTSRGVVTNNQTQANATGADFTLARNWPLARGSFFSPADVRGYAAVAVLGQTVAKILFPAADPVGQHIMLNSVLFQVIGVMGERGASPWGSDQDDVVFVPVSTGSLRLFGQRQLQPDDRLHALLLGGLGELQGAEEVAGVGHGHRRHALLLAELHQGLHRDRPLGERIGRVDPQVDEISVWHRLSLPSGTESRHSWRQRGLPGATWLRSEGFSLIRAYRCSAMAFTDGANVATAIERTPTGRDLRLSWSEAGGPAVAVTSGGQFPGRDVETVDHHLAHAAYAFHASVDGRFWHRLRRGLGAPRARLRLERRALETAKRAVRDVTLQGDRVLFVCTKRQLRPIVEQEAERSGAFFVTERWLGGMLTNFATIRKQIRRLKELERGIEEGQYEFYTKKEQLMLRREKDKLDKYLRGVKDMGRLPGALFVVDAKKELIAVKEAKKLGIPVVNKRIAVTPGRQIMLGRGQTCFGPGCFIFDIDL